MCHRSGNYVPNNNSVPNNNIPTNNYVPSNNYFPSNNLIPTNNNFSNYNYVPNNNNVPSNNYVPNSNIIPSNNYVPNNSFKPYNNNQNTYNPNMNSNFPNNNYSGGNFPQSNTISYPMTNQTTAVEYKQCPSKHYFSLCNSNTRYYPTCNICGQSNLQHSWTCFSCNYDMCLKCYDKDNSRPTSKVKVCNNRHLLCYTDRVSRPNVQCDVCGKKNPKHQYTCWECNYDECKRCYEGRKAHDCKIF